jgi:hypothetical protein
LCGTRIYRLCYTTACAAVSGQTTVTWVTIVTKTGATDTFTLTASPNTITQSGQAIIVGGSGNTFYLLTTLANYANGPSNVETITISVVAATCDCNKARWTIPGVATLIQNISTTTTGYTFNALAVVSGSVNTSSSSATADTVEMRAC